MDDDTNDNNINDKDEIFGQCFGALPVLLIILAFLIALTLEWCEKQDNKIVNDYIEWSIKHNE